MSRLSFILILLAPAMPVFCQWTTGSGTAYYNPTTTKVGVGTSSPSQLLTVGAVGGAGQSYFSIGTNRLAVESSFYSYGSMCAGESNGDCSGTNGVIISATSQSGEGNVSLAGSGPSYFYPGSGNVGIGISSPQTKLHLKGSLATPSVWQNGDYGDFHLTDSSSAGGDFTKLTFNNAYPGAGPVAAIGIQTTAFGSNLYLGTWCFGAPPCSTSPALTNNGLVIDYNGNLAMTGTQLAPALLGPTGESGSNVDATTTNIVQPRLVIKNRGSNSDTTGQDILRLYGDNNGADTMPSVRVNAHGDVYLTRQLVVAGIPNQAGDYFTKTSVTATTDTQWVAAVMSDELAPNPVLILSANQFAHSLTDPNGVSFTTQPLIHGFNWDGSLTSSLTAAGNLSITGTLTKGAGSFKIDHPIEPDAKYLSHSFVESPDMKNIYDGTVILDPKGEASVVLPDWFEALNKDFRYQLTSIGQYAPIFVSKEIEGNRFSIAGGHPGMKVSWQVTGTRHDAYAEAHRIPVEEAKVGDEKGTYLHPELYVKNKKEAASTASNVTAQ